MTRKAQVVVTFKARPELKEWLVAEAQNGFRSVSAEIAMRLERVMADAREATDTPRASDARQGA